MRLDVAPLARRRLPRDCEALARFLIGHHVVRRIGRDTLVGRIVETEAYLHDDPAGHGFIGMTARNRAMFAVRGNAYVYRIYGMWHCLNVSAGDEGEGAAVLIRAFEPIAGADVMRERRGGVPLRDVARGPGRLCEALGVDLNLNGLDMCAEAPLFLAAGYRRPPDIGVSVRIGITKAAEAPLRFFERGSAYVSGPRALNL